MTIGWWLALALSFPASRENSAAIGLGGASLGAGLAVAGWYRIRRHPESNPAALSLRRLVNLWDSRDVAGLDAWLSAFAGAENASHASRTSALNRMIAEQLAVPADAVDELVLAGLLHVATAAEGGQGCGGPDTGTLGDARGVIAGLGHQSAVRSIEEAGERWDGTGEPGRLIGEEVSLAGRILATACAFDRASEKGLDSALFAIRDGSGSAFDPVVVGELIYLFAQPWQSREAA